jgi:diguanylate cyclase (GGDEF)-like protein
MGKADVSGQSEPSSDVGANSLIARYSALNADRANGAFFRYRLLGASPAWTETTQRELQFAQLAPGSYRLEVEVQGVDGMWSKQGASFSFRILTPWYWSWWFISLCVLFPLTGAGGAVRLRILVAQRRERELRRLQVAHDEIRNLAFYDPLTGLPNRRLLLNRLHQTLSTGRQSNRKRAMLFVDLDNFKTLNDTLGHQIGDLMLQDVAQRVTRCIRQSDIVARLGGDEFVVLLEDLSEVPEEAAAQAKSVGAKILNAISKPYWLSGHECRSTSSIGITVFENCPEAVNKVLQEADIAMYQAKAEGRNTMHCFAPALQAAVNARAEMEGDLRKAVEEQQFVLYYQPQMERGRLVGAEALVRWHHPKHGILAPGTFIPLAEETGLILPLGNWVLESACRQIAVWADGEETRNIAVSVNISAGQLRQPDFVENVLRTLEATGANPQNLELELTESMLVDDVEDIIIKMTELKSHGLRFSLDDFGTGYSSLSYLKRLPLDQLKIDRSFVRDILSDSNGGAIAQAIISLSRTMGLSVIAEGVETDAQREYLLDLGCQAYQGYLFSRPIPIEEFELLLWDSLGIRDSICQNA